MGVTYTSGRNRGRQSRALGTGELALVATTLVSLFAIGLCFAGRMHAFDVTEGQRAGGAAVSLVDVTSAGSLEGALSVAFSEPGDRRFAAQELLAALNRNGVRATLPNVGALSRITVTSAAIDRTRGLGTFAARLRDARARASSAHTDLPTSVPLFTTGDLSALKPAFIVRSRDSHRATVQWCALALLLGVHVVSLVWRWRGLAGDRVLLAAVQVLTTLGFVVMLSRPDPLRDGLLVVRYTEGVVAGLAVCLALSFVRLRTAAFLRLGYVSLVAAAGLALALIVFGSGPGSSGAKVNLGAVQPIEAIRLLIAFFLAGYLGRRWELVRQVRGTTVHLLPVLFGVAVSLLLFFALRDLGPALLLSLMVMSILAVARARVGLVAAGVAMLAAGFYGGYWLGISNTLTARVAMWRSPWENVVRGGDQVAQAAWALAAGAIPGTGSGLGDLRYLPAGHTDLVLAGVGEEFGIVGLWLVGAAFALIAWRGLRIARRASNDTTFFLAVAMTLALIVPALVMAAGILGMIPLTGVVTPFVSYGGSAMIANFAALGLLVAARSDSHAVVEETPFHVPLRWLGGALATAGLALLIVAARVQVVAADRVLVKPQLSLQADGGLRYQYNPRVLEAARTLPRGTIVDRRDLPIAGAPKDVRAADAQFGALRISLKDVCRDQQERCYPFGGTMFHLLGNATTRMNWAASNTSYVERDAEDSLRGFDDRAMAVTSTAGDGSSTVALRRDYQDVVPLVRHRWEPDHPAVRALVTRSRDLHLTLDARLQVQVASIVARAALGAGVQHAAVVVLDAESGEVLASVSYPWPTGDAVPGVAASDALLDRARYGLYPPGSTFKLVTAAAALRLDRDSSALSFTCERLPGDRVGAKIPGWSRPVRDDVLDHHPHGTLAMHDGLVHSCNAYFAQLAVRVGADALAESARAAGIQFPMTSPARTRETLPNAGYGQGDVLATPLRMARVAAAIGSGGLIREVSLVQGAAPATPTPFLSAESSRLLADYMRDVVKNGTGRLLRDHPSRIAGKTGTAEVDDAPSHAWFVGFAPYGPATRRIAFAVILENAGYGGASAASVAGQVVSAAASLGLVK